MNLDSLKWTENSLMFHLYQNKVFEVIAEQKRISKLEAQIQAVTLSYHRNRIFIDTRLDACRC